MIAAEQLSKEGVEVSAGRNASFLLTSAENARYERRVKSEELIEKGTDSNIRKYLLLLYASASDLPSLFGHSTKDVYDLVRGYQRSSSA